MSRRGSKVKAEGYRFPGYPSQLAGDTDTAPRCENSLSLVGLGCEGARRKVTTDDFVDEDLQALSPRVDREDVFIKAFPCNYWKTSFDDPQGMNQRQCVFPDAEPGPTDAPERPSGASISLSTEKSFDSDNVSPPMTQRGDKLRDQVRAQLVPPLSSAGQLEKLRNSESGDKAPDSDGSTKEESKDSALDKELVRRYRSQTDLGDAREAPRDEMEHMRSLSESHPRRPGNGSDSPARQASRPEVLSPRRVNEIPKRISATQLLQSPNQQPGQMPGPFPQAVVETKTELSLNGDTLDLLMAPGDVLLMRGSGRISDIGNAGGFMGHVLVVTATPQMVRANTPDAKQLSSVWPNEAKALWRVGTTESTRRESGLYECESLLYVDPSRQLLLIGEVERDGDVCNFEPHEVVEIWQSPEAFRGSLRLDLMGTVLQDMRKNQASWSATTAARAVLQSAELSTARSNVETLEEMKSCWEKAPICTSIVIMFWQRYLEKFAGCLAVPPPDLRPEARFAPKQDVSFWNSGSGSWQKGVVLEQVMEGNQLLSYNLDVKKGVSPHEVRRRFDDEAVATKVVELIRKVIPLKSDRALPGVLMKTMKSCNWSCISQVPQVFRPVVKLTQQMLVPMVPGVAPGQPAAVPGPPAQPGQPGQPGMVPSGTPPQGPQGGSPTRAPAVSPQQSPQQTPSGSPNATPPGSLPPGPAFFGHNRSQSPPPMAHHRSQQVPVYAMNRRPAPPNGNVPVYALPSQPPSPLQEPMPQEPAPIETEGIMMEPQMGVATPDTPKSRQSGGLSVEIAQELGNNARLEIEKMETNKEPEAEKNASKAQGRISFEDSFELGDFADIRNSDGSIGVPLAPGQSRVML